MAANDLTAVMALLNEAEAAKRDEPALDSRQRRAR